MEWYTIAIEPINPNGYHYETGDFNYALFISTITECPFVSWIN